MTNDRAKGMNNDLISRQAVEDALYEYSENNGVNYNLIITEYIDTIPSVNPQEPKTGHWNVVSDGYGDSAYICECSECKDTVWVYKNADRKWNYCPNCGARMVEPQESEKI